MNELERRRKAIDPPDSTRWRETDFAQTLGKYLSPEQLDAMETRRTVLVRHIDHQIAIRGEAVVLYDLPAGR
jgi:hypothetical protein